MGRLTTHILDTANGTPAAGVTIRVFKLNEGRKLCAESVSNTDGRTDNALLQGRDFAGGVYELEFDIGRYFAALDQQAHKIPFLDTVVIRVSLCADENYHVPLLASPWSYSTYRGS